MLRAPGRTGKITAKHSHCLSVPNFEWRSTANDQVGLSADEFLRMVIAMDKFVGMQLKKDDLVFSQSVTSIGNFR